MKKTLFIGLAAIVLVAFSCKNAEKPATETDVTDQVGAITDSVALDNAHNAKNSLTYVGTYKGTLPTASGEGVEQTIVLTDSTFVKSEVYIGKKGVFEKKGSYTWNEAGNTITLVGADAPNQYFVGENTLTQLDIEGKKIEGELAAKYILKK